MLPVPIYTPGWRETKWSKVCCLRKQCNGQSLTSTPPDLEFEVLTSRPHKPPSGWDCLWKLILQAMLPTILLRTTLLYLTVEPVCTAQASCQWPLCTSSVENTALPSDSCYFSRICVISSKLCSSNAWWPMAPNFCSWATRKFCFFA